MGSNISLVFIFTNYNNASYTRAAVESIYENGGEYRRKIIIVDNQSDNLDKITLQKIEKKYDNVTILYESKNNGYFGGLNIGLDYLKNSTLQFDCVIIGNNDLVFPKEFFKKIKLYRNIINTNPVVSPNLISLDGVHQNPHVIKKISFFRELVWDIYYSNYYISLLIMMLVKRFNNIIRRRDYLQHEKPGYIYQGYGACYILGPIFFEKIFKLWAPTFLMGEEFFLSMQLNKHGYSFYYEPEIIVEHHDHATCDKLSNRNLWEISKKSHMIYRKYVRAPLFRFNPKLCPDV